MKRIDISKLLRECPKGMELDCTVFENLTFEEIDEVNSRILCNIQGNNGKLGISFNKFGCYSELNQAKCVIFPKGKTTWEGFVPPCKFKDGDILVDNIFPFIYKDCDKTEMVKSYCGIDTKGNFWKASSRWTTLDKITFATEEQKEKLFQAIKDNGYRWNPETKKLEKLIESKEDTNVEVVMSGIYFDREYYANEVELHLGDYEIEVRDGRTYAVFKNQETKISKPIFKVGDKIKNKDTVLTIITVQTDSYIVEDEPDNFGILVFSQQDKWELINEPKFKVGDRIKRIKTGNIYEIIKIIPNYYITRYLGSDIMISFNDQDEYELVPVEPKFKVGDKIKQKGLDILNPIQITGVNPKIYTFRDGSFQYVEIIDRDYELIIDEPKFKVGDRIRYAGDDFPIKIIDIKNNQYHIECFCDKHNVYKNGIIHVSQQDNYMLIPKFDISSLKPYDKVLVRDTKEQVWVADLFSHVVNRPLGGYTFACVGHYPSQCIPYEGNEHLLGTTDDCDDFFNLIS